jgi:Glycosyl hydrolases family 18
MSVTSSNPKAFTEVSPDFYTMTTSGTPTGGGGTYDGLSIAQIASQVHGAGMKLIPLIYGGNTDYPTFLGDSNAQTTFINWLVSEGQTNAYDGWNIDWEPNSISSTQFVSFLSAAKAALHAKNMILTVDIGGWYIQQCGANGIDLAQIGPAVDVAIIEDYAGGEGTAPTTCAGQPTGMINCDAPDLTNYFGAQLGLMCDVSPVSAVGIGLIEGQGGTGANPFLPQALTDIATIGFTTVAVWPDEDPFLVPTNIPNGGTWYSNLAQFLAH